MRSIRGLSVTQPGSAHSHRGSPLSAPVRRQTLGAPPSHAGKPSGEPPDLVYAVLLLFIVSQPRDHQFGEDGLRGGDPHQLVFRRTSRGPRATLTLAIYHTGRRLFAAREVQLRAAVPSVRATATRSGKPPASSASELPELAHGSALYSHWTNRLSRTSGNTLQLWKHYTTLVPVLHSVRKCRSETAPA